MKAGVHSPALFFYGWSLERNLMEEVFEITKAIGSFMGAISTSIACVMLFVKPLRKWCIEKIRKASKSDNTDHVLKEYKDEMESMRKAISELKDLLKSHIESDEKWKRKVTEEFKSQNETNQVELRNTMNTIYDKNYENKSLTLREKESLVDLFDRYSAIGGNHGMKFKFDEMMNWEIRN